MAAASSLPRSVKAAHILIPADKAVQIEKIQQLLAGGADFAVLAKEQSICMSGRRGGDLGWISRGTYPHAFEKAAFAAKVGEVVTAETDRGLHVIKIMDERYQAEVQNISVQELAEVLSNPTLAEDLQLVDVREPWEHDIARLPGFRLMPLSQASDWAPTVKQDLDPQKETLVLCHHGVRSMNMAMYLAQQGFANVKNITGGIDAYSRGVDAKVPMY